jgi:alkylation response protein AidB-like acyl-CoA dehydrogenase
LAVSEQQSFSCNKAIKYGNERKQFGVPIIRFGMQKERVANMITDIFSVDSALYRISGNVDDEIHKLPEMDEDEYNKKVVSIIKKYAPEMSITKIAGSEMLNRVGLDSVKLHGGYGFSEEYTVERLVRDNVVDMIFEGTNEINRLVLFDNVVRGVFGGTWDFRSYIEAVEADIRDDGLEIKLDMGEMSDPAAKVLAAKRTVAHALNYAVIHTGKNVRNEQELMRATGDALIAVFTADSTVQRVYQLLQTEQDPVRKRVLLAIGQVVAAEKAEAAISQARMMITGTVAEGELESVIENHEKLALHCRSYLNKTKAKRIIGDYAIDFGKYPF